MSRFCDSRGLFIYYTYAQVQRDLHCSVNTAIQSLNELENAGLIKKECQDGQPNKIYVYNILPVHPDTEKITYHEQSRQNFNPNSPAPLQKRVSFDTEVTVTQMQKNRRNFGEIKTRRPIKTNGLKE